MAMLDDPLGASASELSEELIFLIASASTDDQRKRATELFRYYSRQLAEEAFRRGQESVAVRQLPPAAAPPALEPPAIQLADHSAAQTPQASPSVIPQIRWHD